MMFQTVNGKKVSIINHTEKIIQTNPFIEIHIGTDSHRCYEGVVYVTAIAYRYPARGVHYIYNKVKKPPIKDNWSRLWLETELSLETAEILSSKFPGIRFEIDMDYNDDEYYESHRLVSSARGWASSYGYKVNIKPYKQIATRAADYHCK